MADKNYVRVTYTNGSGNVAKVRLPLGSDDPMKYRMFQLAEYGVSLLRDRASRCMDSSDAAMPPLSGKRPEGAVGKNGKKLRQTVGYADWKRRNIGNADRNLYGPGSRTFIRANGKYGKQKSGTGHMLDDIHVTRADERRAQIDITTQNSRQKARGNELSIRKKGGSGWWGWSPRDMGRLIEAGGGIIDERISSFQLAFYGIPARINKAIPPWRDATARTFGDRKAA